MDENSKLKDDVQKDTVLIKTKLPENLYEKYGTSRKVCRAII